LRAKNGRLFGVSVDPTEKNAEVVAEEELLFTILSDAERTVIRAFGLVHEHGGPDDSTIAVPAQVLLRKGGSIAWHHVARSIPDRAAPEETLDAIARL
jgi:peroxiredoxin